MTIDASFKTVDVALILAAGMGSRLSGKTDVQKPLVSLLGLSLAERVLCAFQRELGVNRFVVVVGHDGDIVRAHFEDVARRRQLHVDFVLAREWKLGNGASALAAKEKIGSDYFYLAMVDHVFDPEVARLLVRHAPQPGQISLAVDHNKSAGTDFIDVTRVQENGTQITNIGKQIEQWNAVDTGVFLCTPALFEGLEKAAGKKLHTLSDGVRELAREGRAHAVDVTGYYWSDVDTPEDLFKAKSDLLRANSGKRTDGPISRHLNRPISRLFTRYLVRTSLSPNQISCASFALACLAAVFFAFGGYGFLVFGGITAQLSSILDGCDGDIARLKHMKSQYGAWLDAVLDRYGDAFLVAGLTWHIHLSDASMAVWLVGFSALLGSFMNSYTADKYDGWMEKRFEQSWSLRLGRDLRIFIIFVGALFNLPYVILGLIAVVMNVEALRRLLLVRHLGESVEVAIPNR